MAFPGNSLRWFAAVAVALTVAVLSLRHYFPPLPTPLVVDLVLDQPEPGKSEPLITSGRPRAGDFLFFRHLENNAIAFGYETWGEPSQYSPAVKLPADRRFRLRVEMPALTQIRGGFAPPSDRVRIVANDVEVLNLTVNHHARQPAEIYFAENPIGGTATNAQLNGRLILPDGRELRGYPAPFFTARQRIVGWILISRWQALSAVLLGVVTFVVWRKVRWREMVNVARTLISDRRAFAGHRYGGQMFRRIWRHRWFVLTAVVSTLSFMWMVSGGTMDFIYAETFGDFYDHQAVSLLQGRLDVPDAAITWEAFVVDGKRYGYFGFTPALLRLPFVIFGAHFGELSRAYMVAYFIATLLACYLVLRAVNDLSGRGGQPPPIWATLCVVGGAGLGSTIYYLGSRAYIYHEAILCGVMFAMFGCWAALRHFGAPERRWWIISLVCGVLSVHSRPPTGLFALTFLATMAAAVMVQRWNQRATLARPQVFIGLLCVFGVFTFNIVSYLKFKTFEGCPLRYNVQYDANRLARIDGKQFHLINLPISIDSYFVRPNFHFERGFPFFFIGDHKPPRPPHATKIDYHEPTLGFPYAMPGFFVLVTLGGITAFALFPALRWMILATWISSVPMTIAMFTAIAITHRYTADFCPFVFSAGALGVVGIEQAPPIWRTVLRTTVSVGTVCAVLITLAVTLHYQGNSVWGVPDDVRANYSALRRGVDTMVEALRP